MTAGRTLVDNVGGRLTSQLRSAYRARRGRPSHLTRYGAPAFAERGDYCGTALTSSSALARQAGQISEAKRLRELEAENGKLLAEAHLDLEPLKMAFGVKR